jgi:hypothetical protein
MAQESLITDTQLTRITAVIFTVIASMGNSTRPEDIMGRYSYFLGRFAGKYTSQMSGANHDF